MISGILKMSFVDYPGEMSFVIFLGGCNLRCPFCHNESIVLNKNKCYEVDEVLNMLEERKNIIKAVVISGGEPTLWDSDLIKLIKLIKTKGLKVKLDTNGTNPQIIKKLIDKKLIDYIAMDIKNSFSKYNSTCGMKVNIEDVKKSIDIIESANIDYQFRTTLNSTMHSKEDISEISSYIKDKNKLIFQEYKYNKNQLVNKDYGIFLFEKNS